MFYWFIAFKSGRIKKTIVLDKLEVGEKYRMLFYYICAIFTIISAAVSFGFSVDAFQKAKQEKTEDLTNAKYAMSRNLSLFLTSIGVLVFQNHEYLAALSVAMIIVQLLDGIIGIKISIFKTVDPLLTAVGNAVILVLYLIN